VAQFSPTQLARLLKNVDRETLVEALEQADLTSLLTQRHLRIIEDSEGDWNTLFNVLLSGLIADAGTTLAEANKTAYDPLWHQGPDSGRRLIGELPQTGILFIDAMVASVITAAEIFGENGFLNRIRLLVEDLQGTITVPSTRTNIYDLDQVLQHAEQVVNLLGGVESRIARIEKNLDLLDFTAVRTNLQQMKDLLGDLEEGAYHDLNNVTLHTNRFINDMLGETYVEDIYH